MQEINTPFGVIEAEHAKDLLQPPTKLLDRQVLSHARRWQLVGMFLRCVSCGQSQKASDGARPFPHTPSCRALNEGTDNQFPWHELEVILQNVPR
ncbi:hypothetical protein ACCD10_22830 [Pseudomonas sp. Pseusp122]|uniref:hypothetical protein n=1 Tax=unclassified Pseudomonas TaxID=196821 RepID=UPI0039A404EB